MQFRIRQHDKQRSNPMSSGLQRMRQDNVRFLWAFDKSRGMTEMRQTRGREGIVKKSRRLLEAEEDEAVLVASQGRKRKRAARQNSEAETEPVQEPPPRAEQVVKVGSNEVGVEPPSSGQIDAIEEPQGAATVKAPSRAKPKRRGVRQTVTEAEPPVLQQKSTSPEARAGKSEKRRSKLLQSPEPPVGLDTSNGTAVSPTRVGILVITQTSSGEPPQETIGSTGPSDTAPEIQQTQKPAMRRSKRSRDVEAPSKTTIKQANEIAKPVTRPPRRSKRSKKGPPQPGCLQLSPNTVENDIYLMVQLGVSNQTSKKRRSRIRSQEATPPQIKTPDTGKLAKRLFESMRSPVW